jgi:hypothetical protein
MGVILFLAFIVLFLFFLFSLSSVAEGRGSRKSARLKWLRPSSHSRAPQHRAPRPARGRSAPRYAAPVEEAAARAMWRAGYEADGAYVQVTDIGLLSYRHIDEPKLVRMGDVVMDTRFLRPFAEVWLPYDASGNIRFEMFDDQGRRRYADETRYDLKRGKNTLLPGTWLPLEGKAITPHPWALRLLADDTLLAEHSFGWEPVGGGEIQRYVGTDGEISPMLHEALRVHKGEAVSLSELLADQED